MEQEIIPIIIPEVTVALKCKYYVTGFQYDSSYKRNMIAHSYPDALAAAAKIATDLPGVEVEIKKVYYVDKAE